MKKTCKVEGCENKSRSVDLCGKHLMRFKRHGDTDLNKKMHGMTGTDIHGLWSNIKRDYSICKEWEDFKTFYNDVGDRPVPGVMLKRNKDEEPYSKDNFYWHWSKAALNLKEKWDNKGQ